MHILKRFVYFSKYALAYKVQLAIAFCSVMMFAEHLAV